ncbi:MAG: hypothetical protein HYV03_05635 [Deltaproteobacteria bacterium]|nr:hypothetical protein [Deltaproteobacteria bacterium]
MSRLTLRWGSVVLVVAMIACLIIPAAAWAQIKTTHIGDGYPNLGQGVRPLGMGNAFLTMEGTDENALFYNPAALDDFDKNWRYGTFLIPGVYFNKGLIKTVKDVLDMGDALDTSGSSTGDIQAFQDFFGKHVGEFQNVSLKMPLFSMIRKGWGGGILVDSRTTFAMRGSTATPNVELRSRSDAGVVLAKSVGLLGNDLAVGVLVKGLYRLYRDRILVTSDFVGNSSLNDLIGYKTWGKAFGIGGDIGIRYKLPVSGVNPAVAVVYQDIGRTRFFGTDTDDTPQVLSAGVGIHPELGDFGTSVEVSMTDLTQRRDLMTRLHAGAELRFPWFGVIRPSLRAGMNQGYPTGGFSLDFKKVRFDGAFYGEEVGETSRQGKAYKFAAEMSVYF